MCLFVFICDCIYVNVYGNVIYELQNDVKMIHISTVESSILLEEMSDAEHN